MLTDRPTTPRPVARDDRPTWYPRPKPKPSRFAVAVADLLAELAASLSEVADVAQVFARVARSAAVSLRGG